MQVPACPDAFPFAVVHRLKRRLRIAIPALKKDRERLYILEILLRKRSGIRDIRLIVELGQVVVHFQPLQINESHLLALLAALVPNLGQGNRPADSSWHSATESEREYLFAIEGLTCTSCALRI